MFSRQPKEVTMQRHHHHHHHHSKEQPLAPYRLTSDEGELNIFFDTISDVRFYFGLLAGTLFMLVIS